MTVLCQLVNLGNGCLGIVVTHKHPYLPGSPGGVGSQRQSDLAAPCRYLLRGLAALDRNGIKATGMNGDVKHH